MLTIPTRIDAKATICNVIAFAHVRVLGYSPNVDGAGESIEIDVESLTFIAGPRMFKWAPSRFWRSALRNVPGLREECCRQISVANAQEAA